MIKKQSAYSKLRTIGVIYAFGMQELGTARRWFINTIYGGPGWCPSVSTNVDTLRQVLVYDPNERTDFGA